MPRSLKVRHDCIHKVKLAVTGNGYPNQRALAHDTGLALATVSNFLTGKPVGYATFEELCRRLNLDWREISNLNIQPQLFSNNTLSDVKKNIKNWGTAIDVSSFCGRCQELFVLKSWIVQDHCRLVAVLGMGGVGKTALVTQLAQQIQDEFDYVIWRRLSPSETSLRSTPSFDSIMTDLVSIVSNQQSTKPDINLLIDYLRTNRCLIILDNLETVLDVGYAGNYRPDYQGYGELIRVIGEAAHHSCLIITSREKPAEVALLEGEKLLVRSLNLIGSPEVAFSLLQSNQLLGSDEQKRELCDRYSNNPLKVKIIANSIIELFDGNIGKFIEQNTLIVTNISSLLEEQLNRISDLEQEIMYWLAINRELTTIVDLAKYLVSNIFRSQLLQGLESLIWRSLIEKKAGGYTQQPIVMDYITEKLHQQILIELINKKFCLFNRYALIIKTAKYYIQATQMQLILQPIAEKFRNHFTSKASLYQHIRGILNEVQKLGNSLSDYGCDNLIHLCRHLEIELTAAEKAMLKSLETEKYCDIHHIPHPELSYCDEMDIYSNPI
ncbi:MAG: NB-ARC domain-containing protein [Gloeotrichia echinulata GP01]